MVYRKVVETPTYRVYVHKWEAVMMGAVGKEYEDPIFDRIEPHTRPRKPIVAEASSRHPGTRGRSFRRCELKPERAVLIHPRRKVRPKQLRRFGLKKSGVLREKLHRDPEHVLSG